MKTLSTMKEAWPVRREGGGPSTEEGWGRLCGTEKQGALTVWKDVEALAASLQGEGGPRGEATDCDRPPTSQRSGKVTCGNGKKSSGRQGLGQKES